MRRRSRAALLVGVLLLGLCATLPAADAPQRIVSLVPSVTETLFAVGAGPQVVAVSSYDRRPPEVEKLPKVGALIDPNVEKILSLRPDLVIVYGSQDDLRRQLERASIASWAYRHGGLREVIASIRTLGALTGHQQQGERVAAGIESRLERVRSTAASRPRPRVLLVFGREPGALRSVNASGGIGFLHDLLEIAGGANVFADVQRESVQATAELILARAPDVIIELSPDTPARAAADDAAAWSTVGAVPAVRTRRIHRLVGDEFVVPGPRVAEAAEKLAAVIGR